MINNFRKSTILAMVLGAGNLLAEEGTVTSCPGITGIQYIEGLAVYRAVLPGTGITIESQPIWPSGTITGFDSVIIDRSGGAQERALTHCVYRFEDEEKDAMVLWFGESLTASAATGPWDSFSTRRLHLEYCYDLEECHLIVNEG
jgi:hypothetical protein